MAWSQKTTPSPTSSSSPVSVRNSHLPGPSGMPRGPTATRRADLEVMRVALEALRAEVDRLKARLDQNSSNSHRPPSTDPPGVPKPPKKKPTGRKKGGQRGRVGRARVLLPVDEVTQVVPCKPSHCTDCGTALAGDDTSPERHQVTEIPRVAPTVIEYQVHALRCPCGAVTHGRLPEGVTYSAFGARLQALVVMLSAVYRLSKRNIQRLMADYLSINLSVGSISKLEASMSQTWSSRSRRPSSSSDSSQSRTPTRPAGARASRRRGCGPWSPAWP